MVLQGELICQHPGRNRVILVHTSLIEQIVKALDCHSLPIRRTPTQHAPLYSYKDSKGTQEGMEYLKCHTHSVISLL